MDVAAEVWLVQPENGGVISVGVGEDAYSPKGDGKLRSVQQLEEGGFQGQGEGVALEVCGAPLDNCPPRTCNLQDLSSRCYRSSCKEAALLTNLLARRRRTVLQMLAYL